jgi:hypothetical protein
LVTVALQNGKPGIFGEAVVGERELAEEKDRTSIGLDTPNVNTGRAEAGSKGLVSWLILWTHRRSLSIGTRNLRQAVKFQTDT